MATELPEKPPSFVERWKDTAVVYGAVTTGTLAILTILTLFVIPNLSIALSLFNIAVPVWHIGQARKGKYDDNFIHQYLFLTMVFVLIAAMLIGLPIFRNDDGTIRILITGKQALETTLSAFAGLAWYSASAYLAFRQWRLNMDRQLAIWKLLAQDARTLGKLADVVAHLADRLKELPPPAKTFPVALPEDTERRPPAS